MKKELKISLIRLEPILKILEATIWTGKVSGEQPVSLMLIASQESAKTSAMKHFRGTSTLQYLADVTGNGVLAYKSKIEARELRHFMLNDLTRILAHSKGVGDRTLQTFATLMEEGESESSDPSGRTKWEGWPTVGVIMGITPQFYNARQRRWTATGFATRFLPIRFSYRESTQDLIHDRIRTEKSAPQAHPINFKEKGQTVVKLPDSLGMALQERAKSLGVMHDTYGFRFHRAMRRLAKGRALSQDRGVVNSTDIKAVLEWSRFFGEGEDIIL
jgi:hypothetical protein